MPSVAPYISCYSNNVSGSATTYTIIIFPDSCNCFCDTAVLQKNGTFPVARYCIIYKYQWTCYITITRWSVFYFTEYFVRVEEFAQDGDRGVPGVYYDHVELVRHHRQRNGLGVSQVWSRESLAFLYYLAPKRIIGWNSSLMRSNPSKDGVRIWGTRVRALNCKKIVVDAWHHDCCSIVSYFCLICPSKVSRCATAVLYTNKI